MRKVSGYADAPRERETGRLYITAAKRLDVYLRDTFEASFAIYSVSLFK